MKRLNPRDIVIIDAVRTPIAKAEHGAFQHLNTVDLSTQLLTGFFERQKLNLKDIDGFLWANHQNIARAIGLNAGLPVETSAFSYPCSLQALQHAIGQIATQQGDVFIVGGVTTPYLQAEPSIDKHYAQSVVAPHLTDELLGQMYEVQRQEQDIFAVESHKKAWAATQSGCFKNEIIPIEGHNREGYPVLFECDEHIQANANLEAFQALTALSGDNGQITSATMQNTGVGAGAMLVMSAEQAKKLNLKPRAVIRGFSTAGVDPAISGFSHVPAIQKLLQQTGLKPRHIQAYEIEERSATQVLANLKAFHLESKHQHINMNGGTLALGHTQEASGVRMLTTLLNILEQKNFTCGVASQVSLYGQGIATLIERS